MYESVWISIKITLQLSEIRYYAVIADTDIYTCLFVSGWLTGVRMEWGGNEVLCGMQIFCKGCAY